MLNPAVQPGSAPQAVVATERLVLRSFTLADAPELQSLAGVREIADTTLTVPHPYPDGAAEMGHVRGYRDLCRTGQRWQQLHTTTPTTGDS